MDSFGPLLVPKSVTNQTFEHKMPPGGSKIELVAGLKKNEKILKLDGKLTKHRVKMISKFVEKLIVFRTCVS